LQLHTYEQFKVKFYDKIKKNKIIILAEDKCLKNYNISNDTSEWEGRVIKSYDIKSCDLIHFFILRRKFIPPFCDKYEDFIIICNQNLKIFEEIYNEEQCERKRIDYILSENYELNRVLNLFLNSIHNTDDSRVIQFREVLSYLYDTLSLDYLSLNYFTNSIDIIGKEIFLIGIKFIYFLLIEIKKIKDQLEREILVTDFRMITVNNSSKLNTSENNNIHFDDMTNDKKSKSPYLILNRQKDFLNNIDNFIQLYADYHDKLLSKTESNRSKHTKSLKEMTMDIGIMKWLFREILDNFSKNFNYSSIYIYTKSYLN